ncbi:reverse transcriptase domain-containing protein [Tanacetum coccineum]
MSAMANTTPIVTTVTKTATKEKTPKETDAAPRVSILDFCEEHYEEILPVIMDKIRRDKRKESVFDQLSDTYSPSTTKSGSDKTSSRDHSHSRGRPHRRDSSLSRNRPRSRDHSRGIEESYGNTCSSYRTRAVHGHHSRDRGRSRIMKRGRESKSMLSYVSKSGTSDGGHWKSKSKRHKPIDEDDLAVPWSCEKVDPFTPRIRNFESLWKTRIPNNVKTYDGTGDPEDHVKKFQAAAQVERWVMPTWCHMFNSTLTGTARVWFDELPPESIDRYKDLKAAFLAHFMQQKKYIKDPVEIHNIKQKDGETIEDFMGWFKVETGHMKGAPECMRISGFMHGVNNPELTKRLNKHVPKTMEEMMTVTTAFIRGETAAASKKKGHASWKPQDQPKRHASERKYDFRGQSREGRGSSRFTPLIRTPKEILAVEARKFKPPPPMVTPVEKRSKIKQGRDQTKVGKKEAPTKDKSLAIYMVQPWHRTTRQKVTQSFSRVSEITFPPLTTSKGTEGPLVIEAEIGGHMIHRMYVDGGSSTKVLYEHCFNRLRPEIKSQMVPATTSLTGFSGETIWPLGQLRLLVTIGDADHATKAWMNFMIVRSLSPYNGIIGRPGIREIQAVPSTAHRMLKFPVDGGIVTIRSTILIPAECATVTTSSKEILKEAEVRHENFKIALHPNFPDQEVAIGGTLSAKGRTELCSLLKENLDIFAWQPSDMTGVPRSVAEHRLNIREGYSPVRQKKGARPWNVPKPSKRRIVTPFLKSTGKSNLSAATPLSVSWTLTKAITRYRWQSQMKRKRLSTPAKGGRNVLRDIRSGTSLQAAEVALVGATPAGSTQTKGGTDCIPGPELNYTLMEKLVLALVFAAKRSSCVDGSGAGLILTSPRGTEFTYALRFHLTASNNEAEYEALIAGLRIAAQMGVRNVNVSVDSKLVANQVLGTYVTKEENMVKYLEKAKSLISGFANFSISQVPRSKNKKADALSKIASTSFAHLSKQVLVEVLKEKSIQEEEVATVVEEEGPTWMTPIMEYLKDGTLPDDRKEASKLRIKARQYELLEGVLYRRSFLKPWLSMHAGPRSVVAKAMRLGYYWPTMHRDARNMIRTCNDCQIHRPVPRNPQQPLTPITAPWPFYKWGIDIVGPFPEGPGKVKFLIVAMDYFTKWIEAKAVATITGNQVKKFVWDNIVCRFGLPGEIVSDNGKQFSDNPFKDWCEKLNITQRFASVKHPQSNGLVERANRSLGEGIKARLGEGNKNWIGWAHCTMIKSSHGDTPFSLTYGTEAVIPAEIGMPTYRTAVVDAVHNNEELRLNLDLLEERRERAAIREARAKLKMTKYYNARVRGVTFRPGDFVYRSNEASHAMDGGKLGPKWEGPYEVTEALGDGAYRLRSMDGTVLPRTWNIANLKKCYL